MSRRIGAALLGFGLALVLGLFGCGSPGPTRAASITSWDVPAVMTKGTTFTASTDGQAVVIAQFGPRQVARFASEETRVATFSADELPEGTADVSFWIQGTGLTTSQWRARNVRVDRTGPELVRAVVTAAGAGGRLRLLCWDAVALEEVEVSVAETMVLVPVKQTEASPALVPVEVDTSTFPEGRADATVTLRDGAGNQTVVKVPIIIDRTPPLAAFLSPKDGTVLAGPTTVELLASDNLEVIFIEVRASGSALAEVVGPRASLVIDPSMFPKGPISLRAIPRDEVGNAGVPIELRLEVP
jgi:hypothetical protein